jgi:hypothetical protein
MSGFEKGIVCSYSSVDSIKVVTSLKIFIQNLNTVNSESGPFQGGNDLYLNATIVCDCGSTTQRLPPSGQYQDHDSVDISTALETVITLKPDSVVNVTLDVWCHDKRVFGVVGGGEDHMGTWGLILDASTAWGLLENEGVFNLKMKVSSTLGQSARSTI